ncbi:MAG TPA: hypothetical protein PLX66_01725 [Bacilli bacterium]|nr:hypothetical protein [Bacilli bacterium]
MEYFYSWGLLFVLPFTIYFYIKNDKSIRIKMMVSGLGFGIMAVCFSYIYFNYWNPTYLITNFHIEDFLYGFLFAGMITGVANSLNKTKLVGKCKLNIKLTAIYSIILLLSFIIFVNVLKINYIYILSFVPLLIGVISYKKVKGKIINVILTSLISLFITLFVYNLIILIYPDAIINHFLLQNISNIVWLKVPMEEWLFAICLGVGCTYSYEAIFNLKETN